MATEKAILGRVFGSLTVVALALSLVPFPWSVVHGTEKPPATTEACQKEMTQTDLNLCYDKARQAADAELGRRYGQLLARLAGSPKAKDLLREAERAWIRYRDADCAFVASGTAGGSAQPMVLAGCVADMTRQRIDRLGSQLKCEEGDLSCVAPAN
jgi:uncharacterized protein YecT (DUF1311 family)